MEPGLFDDERIRLEELEQRCAELGAPIAVAVRGCGLEFDAETFVVSEIARVAIARGIDAEAAIAHFESRGFVASAVEAIDAAVL